MPPSFCAPKIIWQARNARSFEQQDIERTLKNTARRAESLAVPRSSSDNASLSCSPVQEQRLTASASLCHALEALFAPHQAVVLGQVLEVVDSPRS